MPTIADYDGMPGFFRRKASEAIEAPENSATRFLSQDAQASPLINSEFVDVQTVAPILAIPRDGSAPSEELPSKSSYRTAGVECAQR